MRSFMLATLLAGGVIAAVWAHAQSPIPDPGRVLAANCANCHNTNGRSLGGMPALAGRPKEAIVRQMRDFRSGARPATVMHQIAKGYTDQQIEALASYFAAQAAR